MRTVLLLMAFVIALVSTQAKATTFARMQETCPVCDQPTTVSAVMSYGGYIYQWESKYDLIYFPFTGDNAFWNCPSCGYVQLSPDFRDLPGEVKPKVEEYLSRVFQPGEKRTFADRMERTREIARIRGQDDDDFAWLNRVLIYNYRDLDPARAAELAVEEISLLEKGKGKLPCDPKTRYYLLGEYYRLSGDRQKAVDLLKRSIGINTAARFLVRFGGLCVVAVALLALGAVILRKKTFPPRSRALVLVICLVAVALAGAIAVKSIARLEDARAENKYYTDIARDRLELIMNSVTGPPLPPDA